MEEKINIVTKEKVNLVGVITYPKKPSKKTVVLVHGLGGDKDEKGVFANLAKNLQEEGYTVFRFDYRGHGESYGNGKTITIKTVVHDFKIILSYLRGKGLGPFAAVGTSLGAGIVVLYCGLCPKDFKTLVFWNPGLRLYPRALVRLLPIFVKGRVSYFMNKFRNKKLSEIQKKQQRRVARGIIENIKIFRPYLILKKMKVPVRIIHGTKDKFVSYKDSVWMIRRLSGEKSLILIPGAGHNFYGKRWEGKAIKETVNFIKDYF